jgi:NarL family two-component system response regulator LiaR
MSEQQVKIKVLVVDDHQVVRQGLRTFLELQDDLEVVGEAADGLTAIEMARELKPDIVLMDLVMPKMDGITATRQIIASGFSGKVIALTSFTENDRVFPAIEAGAASYLLKDVSPDNLVESIRAVHRGEARLHPDITKKLMERVAHPAPPEAPADELTERELEVVRLVAHGLSNREISEKLFISEKTVKTHISNVLGKLQLIDRTQIAIYAIRKGLIEKE